MLNLLIDHDGQPVSTVETHTSSDPDDRLLLQESKGGSVISLDLRGIAALLDTVADAALERLTSLLEVLLGSEVQYEASLVVELAATCRDPLSTIGECCCDGLKTGMDLTKLARATAWERPAEVCIQPRCIALLNLCDFRREDQLLRGRRKRQRYHNMRPRLAQAAEEERQRRDGEIRRLGILRRASYPDLWRLYDFYTTKARARRRERPITHSAGDYEPAEEALRVVPTCGGG